jgi:2-polyprenyl-3-methyl-5-hydroxy-6-metoxy-1,4-benzoquinol methylase
LYNTDLKIDVKKYFKTDKLEFHKCKKCGYNFYTPGDVAGDAEFYYYLQMNEWYYLRNKYEHQIAYSFINRYESVLEIGCGEGAFLEVLKENGINSTGLELNKKAIEIGRKKNLNILNETIQVHSENNSYNVICTFQVLEHIFEINSFLSSCINSLKDKGKLIIALPNNDSFIKYSNDTLNMPPHHMGLWNKKSLSFLPNIFPEIILEEIIEEPLQSYHIDYFVNTWNDRFINKIWGLRTIYHRLFLSKFVKKLVYLFRNKIVGHTMIAIYSKK